MDTPLTCRVASAVTSAVGSSRFLRSAGTATPLDTIADSTPSGPSSRKRVTPCCSRYCTPWWKRTASRTCRTQYSAVPSSVASEPVTLDTTRTVGAE